MTGSNKARAVKARAVKTGEASTRGGANKTGEASLDPRRRLGNVGENAVASYYVNAHYRLVARNWRCRQGEIDLVVMPKEGDALVFVEVKTRSGSNFGTGLEAVSPTKQRRLRSLAAQFLQSWEGGGVNVIRFDVAALDVSTSPAELTVVIDAF